MSIYHIGLAVDHFVTHLVEVDVEVFSLVASTMKKMRSISDMEFSRLDLKPYLQDVVAK